MTYWPGSAYASARNMAHFHDDPDGLWAAVKVTKGENSAVGCYFVRARRANGENLE